MEPSKQFTSEERFYLTLTAIVCTTIVLFFGGLFASLYFEKAKAFEQGYEEQSIPGQSGVHWVKRKE